MCPPRAPSLSFSLSLYLHPGVVKEAVTVSISLHIPLYSAYLGRI